MVLEISDREIRTQSKRSLVLKALAATVVVSLLVGAAYVAFKPDDEICASQTQNFLDVDVMKGAALHAHHGHHGTLPRMPNVRWQCIQDKVHKRRDSHSIWGDIPEDNRTDDENIHCGELRIPVDLKIASGEWPHTQVSTRSGSEVPCTGGVADPGTGTSFECKNVDLLSFVPLADFFDSLKANDVWGWVDPQTNKEYAIIGLGEGTGFVDITVPTNPVVVAVMPTTTTASTWRDIKVYGNNAYVVSEAFGHGMQVFDLTRLRGRTSKPAQPDTEDYWMREFGSAHNVVINEKSGRAFAVGARDAAGRTRKCAGGLVIIDVSDPDPTKPRFEGCYSDDGYTHDAECVIYQGPHEAYRGKEICFAYNENSLTIVDVSRTADGQFKEPTLISRTPYDGSQYTHQGWLDADHAFAYMNDELDENRDRNDKRTRTYIFDVRDLTKPLLHDIHWHKETSIDHNNYIKDGFVYQGNYCAGLRILKLLDDHRLEQVAYFDTEPECDQAIFSGVWSVFPYFPSGTVVVSSVPKGLFVFKAQLPA